jgi:class 3 adenylate cyclase
MTIPGAEKVEKASVPAEAARNRPAVGQPLGTNSILGREAKITSHQILKVVESGAREKKGLDILHWHLFDESRQVVLSALEVLKEIGDQRSLKHIVKLLSQPDEDVQCAAVRAIGAIRHPAAAKILREFFKVTRGENPRCAILEVLAAVCPGDESVRRLIQECAVSSLISPKTRALAVGLVLGFGMAETALDKQFASADDRIIETILSSAMDGGASHSQVVKIAAARYGSLSAANRSRSAVLASPYATPDARHILREVLQDPDPAVRQSLYRKLGEGADQIEAFAFIVSELSEGTDADPLLEEEVWAAIQRMEEVRTQDVSLRSDIKRKIHDSVREEFKKLTVTGRQVASDRHELGWMISRSKEYLEYYASEEFRRNLLGYLKEGSTSGGTRLLADLKETAVKVEVRHFDGYRALEDMIKNPKRSGIGLVTRELAIARLGKRRSLYRLIRLLYLCRLLDMTAEAAAAAETFHRIFQWSKQARLYRLTEASLYALVKVDFSLAGAACLECLTPPVFSKICAIAGIRLLHEMEWERFEPVVIALLSDSDDPYILTNLIDGLERALRSEHNAINECLVKLLRDCSHMDVARRAADFLSAHATFGVFESLVDIYDRADVPRQELILMFLARMILENRSFERESLVEFMYKILRRQGGAHRARAALLLWKLGDDLSPRLLSEFFAGGEAAEIITILHGLRGGLQASLVPGLQPLFRSDHAGIHEALRAVVAAVEDRETRDALFELIVSVQELGLADNREARTPEEVRVDFFEEKKAYRFEREYIEELAILFTDIQGYSQKAENLSSLQLTTLLQGYESILLPTVTAHDGELIKRMGDGHLFVFSVALDAVLAAIRVQKALKRFNSYREENQRIIIRIGIHWGKVVRREGDVLGNTVNIASRLENSAGGGSIHVSEALYQQVRKYIHGRDLGLMDIRGLSEQLRVFEPYEIILDLPRELDPMRKASPLRRRPAPTRAGGAGDDDGAIPRSGPVRDGVLLLDSAALSCLSATFSSLNRLCLAAESGQGDVAEIRRELARGWLKLKSFIARANSRKSASAGSGAAGEQGSRLPAGDGKEETTACMPRTAGR